VNRGSRLGSHTATRRHQVFQGRGLSFLLSQVGSYSSRSWTHQLKLAGLDTREVMVVWNIAMKEGRSQRELADALGLPASRLVTLVDRLEAGGLVERRIGAEDRRARALYLTSKGRRLIETVVTVAVDTDDRLAKGLNASERRALAALLRKVASAQGLITGVHPDF